MYYGNVKEHRFGETKEISVEWTVLDETIGEFLRKRKSESDLTLEIKRKLPCRPF